MQNVVQLFPISSDLQIKYAGVLQCELFIDSLGQLRIKSPDNYLRYLEYYHVHKDKNELFLALDIKNQRFHRVVWQLPAGYDTIQQVFARTGMYNTGVVIQRKKTSIVDVDLRDNWGFNLDIYPGQEIRNYLLDCLASLNQQKLYRAVNTYNPNKTLISNYQKPQTCNHDIVYSLEELFERFLEKIEDYIFDNFQIKFDVYGANNPRVSPGSVLQFFLDRVVEIDESFETTQSFVDIYETLQWRLKNPKNQHPSNQLFIQSDLSQIYNIIVHGNTYFAHREQLFKKLKIYHNPYRGKFSVNSEYHDYVVEFLQKTTTMKNFHKISKHLLNSKNTILFLGESHIYQMSYFQEFLSNWRKKHAVQFKLMLRNLQNLRRFIVDHSFYYPNDQELVNSIDFTLQQLTN